MEIEIRLQNCIENDAIMTIRFPKEGVDADLADILKTHILKVAPAQDAVEQAKGAILKLAGERANSLKPEVTGG